MRDLNVYEENILACAKYNGCFDSWLRPEYVVDLIWVHGRDVQIEVKQDGHYYDAWYHTVTDEELFIFLIEKLNKLEAAR